MPVTKTFTLSREAPFKIDARGQVSFVESSFGGLSYVANRDNDESNFQVASPDGDPDAPISGTVKGSFTSSIIQLTNGNYVITTEEDGNLIGTLIGPDGVQIGDKVELQSSSDNGGVRMRGEATALADGGFVLAHETISAGQKDQRLTFYDETFGLLNTRTLIAQDDNESMLANVVLLDDGNVAMAFQREIGTSFELQTQVFKSTGTPVSTRNTIDVINPGDRGEVAIVATDAGYSVFYRSNGDSTGANDVFQTDMSMNGTFVRNANVSGQPETSTIDNERDIEAVRLPDRKIGLTYEGSNNTPFFTQIVSQTAGESSSNILLMSGQTETGGDFYFNPDITVLPLLEGTESSAKLLIAADNFDLQTVYAETVAVDVLHASGTESDVYVATDFADRFEGSGVDTVVYDTTRDVRIDLVAGTTSGAAIDDALVRINNITTGSGDDVIVGSSSRNTLLGNAGEDVLSGFSGDDIIFGGLDRDTLFGGNGADTLIGGDGQDRLFGGQGVDVLIGGAGGDRLYAVEENSDEMAAGGVGSSLFGGDGNDILRGNSGADYLDGGEGADTMSGGLGNDFYIVRGSSGLLTEDTAFSLGGGIDTVRAFISYTQPENIELVRLGNITDMTNLNAVGNDAPGTLVGNAGENDLTGRGGNDQINGNDGDDKLTGNTGRDTLVGGSGADTFIYSSISESRVGIDERDVINGLDRGSDLIDLSAMDANLGFSGDGAFTFIGTSQFAGTGAASAGELRLQSVGGLNAVIVEADLRGDGVADFQVFVNLTTVLDAQDFIL